MLSACHEPELEKAFHINSLTQSSKISLRCLITSLRCEGNDRLFSPVPQLGPEEKDLRAGLRRLGPPGGASQS